MRGLGKGKGNVPPIYLHHSVQFYCTSLTQGRTGFSSFFF